MAATSPSVGGVAGVEPVNAADELGEQPRPAEAAPADDDAVAPGRGHHRQRVVGVEDVAVAQHRDRRDDAA